MMIPIDERHQWPVPPLLMLLGVIVLFAVFIFFASTVTISAGERGVVMRLGAVQDEIMDEGLNFKTPIIESVKELDVKTVKTEKAGKAEKTVKA